MWDSRFLLLFIDAIKQPSLKYQLSSLILLYYFIWGLMGICVSVGPNYTLFCSFYSTLPPKKKKKKEANKQSKTTITYGVSRNIICFKRLCESYLQFIILNKTQIVLFRPLLPFHVFPFSSYAECQTIRSCRCCNLRKTLNAKFPVSGRRLHMKETFKLFRVWLKI